MIFTVLVCGGRHYDDRVRLHTIMNALHHVRSIDLVIHGGASGADILAGAWAMDHGVVSKAFPARWALHGRAAGPMRNKQMLVEGKPDLVLAFPGGTGTADMVRQAVEHGVRTFNIPKQDSFPAGPTILQGILDELPRLGSTGLQSN